MADILVAVSGNIPVDIQDQVQSGKRPRPDYFVFASALPADILDYSRMRREGTFLTRLFEKVGGANAALAWECFKRRQKYALLFTDGEQVGIPLAFFLKFLGRGKHHVKHAMIVHILSTRKKMIILDLLGIQSAIDLFLVYSSFQKEFILQRWGIKKNKVSWIPFQADGQFFQPSAQNEKKKNDSRFMICSAGLEFRDYPTMMAAVDGLDVEVVLAAASPWSKRSDTTTLRTIPNNVTVKRFSLFELRELYDLAAFVVVPLYPVNFQAGVTTIMEAMAMGKAVIVTKTPGQTDYVQEGITGLYVPPGDILALRTAMQKLLQDRPEAERMGRLSKEKFERDFNLDRYVELIKIKLDGLLQDPS
ncbi:MAG: glycosyltransferase family 4 protein [Chloroflexi bacterium]|nr:glycosyltransferase family 4 protein [Chloroflexota bacterium]